MNKKNNRKGFTIVELVIVIAVIAILATVMVPTFGNMIDKAQASAALQEAKSIHTNYVAGVDYANGKKAEEAFMIIVDDEYHVSVVNGSVNTVYETKKNAIVPGTKTLTVKADGTFKYECYSTPEDTTQAVCDWCGVKH